MTATAPLALFPLWPGPRTIAAAALVVLLAGCAGPAGAPGPRSPAPDPVQQLLAHPQAGRAARTTPGFFEAALRTVADLHAALQQAENKP